MQVKPNKDVPDGLDGILKHLPGGAEITLDAIEVMHLVSLLLHAKFSDDVNMDVVCSPTMNALLRGLDEAGRLDVIANSDEWRHIREDEGWINAPPSFSMIESSLRKQFGEEGLAERLAEALYPLVWHRRRDA